MDINILSHRTELKFTEFLKSRPTDDIMENQDSFLGALHTYEDPDTGYFFLTHGMSPDSVAFEQSCKSLSRWNLQYQSISEVAYSADSQLLPDGNANGDSQGNDKDKDILRCF